MKSRKLLKSIGFAAGLLAVTAGLAGCGGEQQESDNNTITWMGTSAQAVEKDSPTEQFIEEKFGVNLEIYSVTTNYYEKLSTMLASGEVPDVMFMGDPQNWQPLVDQGFLAEIPKETIEKYAPNHYQAVEESDPRIWAISTYKDANWTVPKIMGDEYGTVMIWRKDWLNALGIEKVPETLEEFEAAFTKMRNEDPDGNGQKDTYGLTGCGGATQRQFDEIFGAFGVMPGQWTVENDKVINGTTSDKAREALELLHTWYEKELIDPEMITDDQGAMSDKFYAGRIGSYHAGIGNVSKSSTGGQRNINNFNNAHPDKNWDDTVCVGSLPTGPNGDSGDWLWGPRSNFIVFGEQLEDNEEKLGKILNILDTINFDEETALRVVFGEQGRTYDYVDPAVGAASGFTYLPPYDTDSNARATEGIGQNGFFNMLAPSSAWADQSIVDKYTNQEFAAEQEKYADKEHYKDQLMRPYLPSAARYQADLDKMKTTWYSNFITGAKDLSEWDSFVSEYQAAGGSQLEQEAQEFYEQNIK